MTLRPLAITFACVLGACASRGNVVPFSLQDCRGHLSRGEYDDAAQRCDADFALIEQSTGLQIENGRKLLDLADSAIRFGDYRIAERAAALSMPYEPDALAILAQAQYRQGDYEAAMARGAEYLERFGAGAPRASEALEALGMSLATRGRSDEARQLAHTALQVAAAQTDNAVTVNASLLQSSVLWLAGDKAASGEVAAGALELAVQSGLDSSALLVNLARFKYSEGGYDEARALLEKSLAVAHLRLWPGHPEYAGVMNDLGLIDMKAGNTDAAETEFLTALQTRKARLGMQHTAVAQSLNNLGALYHRLGDLDQAAALYERALDINLAVLGRSNRRSQLIFDNLDLLARDRRASPDTPREPKLDGP